MRIGGFIASCVRPDPESPDSPRVFFGRIGSGGGLVNVNLPEEPYVVIIVDSMDSVGDPKE